MGLFSRQKGKRGERYLVSSLTKHGFKDVRRLILTHSERGNNPDVVATDPETDIVWKFENKNWAKLPTWLNVLIRTGEILKGGRRGRIQGTQHAQYIAFGSDLVAVAWKPQDVIRIKDVIFEHRDDTKLYKRFLQMQKLLGVSDILVMRGNYMQPCYMRFLGNWNGEFALPKT